MKYRELSETRPRTVARLLGISRRQALKLIRMEHAVEFHDLVPVLPCGIALKLPTMEALARMKGGKIPGLEDTR
jgi:hypothetical protein